MVQGYLERACNAAVCGIVVVLGLQVCSTAEAQLARPHEWSVDSILKRVAVRERSAISLAVPVLTQQGADASPARLDSLGSGLVVLASRDRTYASVVAAFVIASQRGPKPYAGSFDRLLEIFHSGAAVGVRGAAFHALGKVGQLPRAMVEWQRVATQKETDPNFIIGPHVAVGLMCSLGGREGRRRLRDLLAAGKLHPGAARDVAVMIRSNFRLGCPRSR